MSHGTKIGIVTAAGYTEAERYYGRLHGLLETSTVLTPLQKENLVVMGRLVSLPTIQFIILTNWL
jgi:IMP and pyridine-specific 5'-nucleotidase